MTQEQKNKLETAIVDWCIEACEPKRIQSDNNIYQASFVPKMVEALAQLGVIDA